MARKAAPPPRLGSEDFFGPRPVIVGAPPSPHANGPRVFNSGPFRWKFGYSGSHCERVATGNSFFERLALTSAGWPATMQTGVMLGLSHRREWL